MKYIFDFDDVLFNNTEQFKPHMFKLLAEAGVPEDEARAHYDEVRNEEFSLSAFLATLLSRKDKEVNMATIEELYEEIIKECPNFLNPKVIEMVKNAGKNNCYIVTYGDTEFQQDKIKYSGIGEFFDKENIKIVLREKKEEIIKICNENSKEEVLFIDDKDRFIKELDFEGRPQNLRTMNSTSEEFQKMLRDIDTPGEIKRR